MLRTVWLSLLCLLLIGGAVSAQDAGTLDTSQDQVYQALSAGNVYVDPRIQGVDAQTLTQASMQGQGNPHTFVKIAILANLPAAYSSRNDYASGLHRNLGLDNNALVLVVLRGNQKGKAGVEVIAKGLSIDEENSLARQYGPAIKTNLTDGTAALAQAVAAEINGKEYRSSAGLWVVFLIVIVAIGGLLLSASRRKKKALAQAREPIQALRENVLSGIEYLDGYLDVLPKNNPDSDQVRIFRQSASAKYDQAVKIMDRATELTDLQRAQNLLTQAQADVQKARVYQDRATGGTGNIPGDDALRPPPLPESQSAVEAIPTKQRGVSFFSGQPAPLSSLVPVTITVHGQSRQVLVTPAEADELRRGQMPQVLAFQQGGRYTPWYEYNGYDPYRDYWRYENAGWDGFGSGIVAGYLAADVLDSVLMPTYGMPGYMPYAYATDMPMYQGYSDPGYGASYAGDYGNPGFTPADSGDYGGGADFGGGSTDSGSTDYGGGADFGGGTDFGGSNDFGGGSDFGGGADFGGGGDSGGGGGDS